VKRSISSPYGPEDLARDLGVSRETIERLKAYADLLRRWQVKLNLVGSDTVDDLWRRHILDSGQLARHLPPRFDILYDIGSGAGLPGLILSILGVTNICLVESDLRKAAFLREAARFTGAPASIHAGRLEMLAIAGTAGEARVLTARAVAPLESLLDLARPLIGPGTVCLFHKGANAAAEIKQARRHWSMRLEAHPSLSDVRGVILRIDELAHD